MNKRIQQLTEQATELDYETFDNYNHKIVKHYKFNKEKFAELFVRECADIGALKADGNTDVYNSIVEYFGMQEPEE